MKHRFLTNSLPLTLAALLLLSSCAAPDGDTATTPATTTTTAVTTTTKPENTYRPDLAWGHQFISTPSTPISKMVDNSTLHDADAQIPCTIWLTVWPEDETDPEPEQKFEPIDCFTSLGWEILPEDAWDYVNPAGISKTIFVAPTTGDITKFDMDDLKALLEYYEIDPNLIYEDRIQFSMKQCSLKELES